MSSHNDYDRIERQRERSHQGPGFGPLGYAVFHDVTVNRMYTNGDSLEEIIKELVLEKERITRQARELSTIAPYKITRLDGTTVVWRCPDELVPERKI